MLKIIPKILIIHFAVLLSFALIANYANAEIYTCKNGNICGGTFDSVKSPISTYKDYCQGSCPSGYSCTKYDSTTGCVGQTGTAAPAGTTGIAAPFKPQIGIGTDFQAGKSYTSDGTTKMIGEYIRAIYKYAIGIVGILAAVVLMIGGILWIVAGGNATAIGEAKAWIGASLTGLLLALLSYLILATVNPALVELNTTGIKKVQEVKNPNSNGILQDNGSACCNVPTDCNNNYFCNTGVNQAQLSLCNDNTKKGVCQLQGNSIDTNTVDVTRIVCSDNQACPGGYVCAMSRCRLSNQTCGSGYIGICYANGCPDGKSRVWDLSNNCESGMYCCK